MMTSWVSRMFVGIGLLALGGVSSFMAGRISQLEAVTQVHAIEITRLDVIQRGRTTTIQRAEDASRVVIRLDTTIGYVQAEQQQIRHDLKEIKDLILQRNRSQ